MGRIRFRRVRFQTPNSVSFWALTEFRRENSMSSSQPIICVPKWGSVSSLLRNSTLETVFRPFLLKLSVSLESFNPGGQSSIIGPLEWSCLSISCCFLLSLLSRSPCILRVFLVEFQRPVSLMAPYCAILRYYRCDTPYRRIFALPQDGAIPPPFRIHHKKGPWWVARLKCSFSLEIQKIPERDPESFQSLAASAKVSHERAFTLIRWQPGSANTGFCSIWAIS